MKRMLVAIPLLTLGLGSTAFAGEGYDAQTVVAHIFEMADSDANGSLSPDEYAAAGLQRFGVSFEQSDLDADGATTLAEYLELYRAHHGDESHAGI